MTDFAVTYIPVTEGRKRRFTTLVKDAPSKEAVEQGMKVLQDMGQCQLLSVVEAFDTRGIQSQIPFSTFEVLFDE